MIRYFLTSVCLLCMGCSEKSAPAVNNSIAASPANVTVDAKTQQQVGIEVRAAEAVSMGAPLTSTGQLQLNEDRTWQVGAMIPGRIVRVPVHLGELVKEGQVVAQMHSHEVHDARANRRQAIAEMERLKVLAEQARRVRDRTQRLFDLKAASREQMEAAETQYQSAQLTAQNAQIEVTKAETHLTEFLDVPLQEATAHVGADEGDEVPIRSPAAGTVMERKATAGTVVSSGDPVLVVSDLSGLWLIAAVNEADLSRIRLGQGARISVRAYPDRTFAGTVFQLGERLDPQTRTLPVRVRVSNTQGLLKPDMFATVDFASQGEKSVVHVPESAVQQMNGKAVVFVQAAPDSFVPREVITGARIDRQVEILSGIEPGTPVVVNGGLLLRSQLSK